MKFSAPERYGEYTEEEKSAEDKIKKLKYDFVFDSFNLKVFFMQLKQL